MFFIWKLIKMNWSQLGTGQVGKKALVERLGRIIELKASWSEAVGEKELSCHQPWNLGGGRW